MEIDEGDPRNVFLSAGDVIRRYRWGQTRGYANLKDPEIVPPPVVTHPARWRLDQLMAWEERRMAATEDARDNKPGRRPRPGAGLTDLLPQPKQRRPPA